MVNCTYKGLLKASVFISLMCLLAGCGEDRTYEYDEKTQRNHHMQQVMQEWYLWGDSIRDVKWGEYFASPVDFIQKMSALSKAGDKWSYCSIDTLNNDYHPRGNVNVKNSYGFDFVIMTDPTGETTKQFARVVTVYPGSPADRCGLRRGDFIAQFGVDKVNTSITQKLQKGIGKQMIVSHLSVDEAEAIYYWDGNDTLQIDRSEPISVPQIWVSKMIGSNVAYLMPTNLNDSEELVGQLSQLISHNPSKVVIDLRFCNQGSLETVVSLLPLLSSEQGAYLQTIWSNRKAEYNETFNIRSDSHFDLCFITSKMTQGAGEWLIHALRSDDAARVKVVGKATAGQNLMLKDFDTEYFYTIHLAVAYVANRNGEYDYSSGLLPDEEVDELQYLDLYPYGDPRETLLQAAINQ